MYNHDKTNVTDDPGSEWRCLEIRNIKLVGPVHKHAQSDGLGYANGDLFPSLVVQDLYSLHEGR